MYRQKIYRRINSGFRYPRRFRSKGGTVPRYCRKRMQNAPASVCGFIYTKSTKLVEAISSARRCISAFEFTERALSMHRSRHDSGILTNAFIASIFSESAIVKPIGKSHLSRIFCLSFSVSIFINSPLPIFFIILNFIFNANNSSRADRTDFKQHFCSRQ